ncbi:MAG: sodium:solute symporter [Lawsonibacter sp.]
MLIATWIIAFVIIVGIGIFSGKAISSSDQWSGADKKLGVLGIGAVLGAWQIGGISIVGAAQNGYNFGIAAMWYSIGGSAYFLVCAVMAKILRDGMPGDSAAIYMRNRYSKTLSRLYMFVYLVMAWIYIPIQLKTVSSVIRIVLPSFNAVVCMVIGLCIAAFYTGFAGMKGAATVGKIVCFGIYALLIVFAVMHLGEFGGYSGLLSSLPDGYGNIFAGTMTPSYVLSLVIGGFLSSSVMQAVLQPIMAAKDYKSARYGCLVGYLMGAPICIITGLMGMMAYSVSKASLDNGSTAFAWIVHELSSPVFAGIIFAIATMIISATMATQMMAAGTLLKNISADFKHDLSDKTLLNISRWGTLIFAFTSLIPALVIPSASLTFVFLTLIYGATCPFSFTIIFGLLWKKVNKTAALWSTVVGLAVAIFWIASGYNTTVCSVVYPTIAASYVVGILLTVATGEKESSSAANV